jgi:hypothetical protein
MQAGAVLGLEEGTSPEDDEENEDEVSVLT